MEYTLLGWPPEAPTLRLDFRTFAYAGKFVMSTTGKAVIRATAPHERPPTGAAVGTDAKAGPEAIDPEVFRGDIIGATAFNEDRTDDTTVWIRYITVHTERRGNGLGAKLAAFTADQIAGTGYDTVRIAVNNVFAYEALHKAGFGYTGRETGLAELVLERPGPDPSVRYQEGLDVFRERDLSDGEASFLETRRGAAPPERVSPGHGASVPDSDPGP
jgi:Acetyltransferase (GNAT) family.